MDWPLPGQMFCPQVELTVCPGLARGFVIVRGQSDPRTGSEALHVHPLPDGVIRDAVLRMLDDAKKELTALAPSLGIYESAEVL